MRSRAALVIFLSILLMGCGKTYNGEELLLEWHDASANITFRVTRHPTLVKQNDEFYVERAGMVERCRIDDDAVFGKLSFVRYGDWLLVLSNDEVWGGYNYLANKLYGEYEWEKLPFTVRRTAGGVVASKAISSYSASPANFVHIPEAAHLASQPSPLSHPATR